MNRIAVVAGLATCLADTSAAAGPVSSYAVNGVPAFTRALTQIAGTGAVLTDSPPPVSGLAVLSDVPRTFSAPSSILPFSGAAKDGASSTAAVTVVLREGSGADEFLFEFSERNEPSAMTIALQSRLADIVTEAITGAGALRSVATSSASWGERCVGARAATAGEDPASEEVDELRAVTGPGAPPRIPGSSRHRKDNSPASPRAGSEARGYARTHAETPCP